MNGGAGSDGHSVLIMGKTSLPRLDKRAFWPVEAALLPTTYSVSVPVYWFIEVVATSVDVAV